MTEYVEGSLPGYLVRGTSQATADVEDIPLDPPEVQANSTTRRIARPKLVDNIHDARARVEMTLMHQRRGSKSRSWEDANSFKLATLKAGQDMRLALSAGQTLRLFQALQELYAITEGGIPHGEQRLVVGKEGSVLLVPENIRETVRAYVNGTPEAFWKAVNEIEPDILSAVAVTQQYQRRRQALDEFSEHLETDDWIEGQWEQFFHAHDWIFGHGLSYQFLGLVENQATYVGPAVSGKGAQRGDFLLATQADVRFTVLVDIKRPTAQLVSDKPYRNKAFSLGHELVGGVAQLQSNCRNWEHIGAELPDNRDDLEKRSIRTVDPKGILVIGHTRQVANDRNRWETFELFRQNLHNPEILTFDELLERAAFVVAHDRPKDEPPDEQPMSKSSER